MAGPPNRLIIRPATESDLRSVVAHYGPGGGDSPWDPFADVDRIQRIPRNGLLVADIDGAYAGFIFWYEARKPWYAKDVDRYARISDLHNVPEFQGRGIGRALIRDALARIRGVGIETVFLETDEDNARARSLYESEGFARFAPSVVRFRLG
jgi:[ribosomal protein S18]-alanine N-acetyltransferase